MAKAPRECFEQFGSDLDGCSTQQNEGCGRCRLAINCDKCLNYQDPKSDNADSCCALCFDGSNFRDSEDV